MFGLLCNYVFLIPLIESISPGIVDYDIKLILGVYLRVTQIAMQIFLYTLIREFSNDYIIIVLSICHFVVSYGFSMANLHIMYSRYTRRFDYEQN